MGKKLTDKEAQAIEAAAIEAQERQNALTSMRKEVHAESTKKAQKALDATAKKVTAKSLIGDLFDALDGLQGASMKVIASWVILGTVWTTCLRKYGDKKAGTQFNAWVKGDKLPTIARDITAEDRKASAYLARKSTALALLERDYDSVEDFQSCECPKVLSPRRLREKIEEFIKTDAQKARDAKEAEKKEAEKKAKEAKNEVEKYSSKSWRIAELLATQASYLAKLNEALMDNSDRFDNDALYSIFTKTTEIVDNAKALIESRESQKTGTND